MNKRHETRAYEVRAAENLLVIEGTAIVFDQPADMYGFSERIARSALEHVDLNDITLLVNHDGTGIPLARSPKTLTLNITDSGLEMRAELPDTEQGRSVYEAVRRGDLSQMSFAFDIAHQEWIKSDSLEPVDYVEGILGMARDCGQFYWLAGVVSLLVLFVPFAIGAAKQERRAFCVGARCSTWGRCSVQP